MIAKKKKLPKFKIGALVHDRNAPEIFGELLRINRSTALVRSGLTGQLLTIRRAGLSRGLKPYDTEFAKFYAEATEQDVQAAEVAGLSLHAYMRRRYKNMTRGPRLRASRATASRAVRFKPAVVIRCEGCGAKAHPAHGSTTLCTICAAKDRQGRVAAAKGVAAAANGAARTP